MASTALQCSLSSSISLALWFLLSRKPSIMQRRHQHLSTAALKMRPLSKTCKVMLWAVRTLHRWAFLRSSCAFFLSAAELTHAFFHRNCVCVCVCVYIYIYYIYCMCVYMSVVEKEVLNPPCSTQSMNTMTQLNFHWGKLSLSVEQWTHRSTESHAHTHGHLMSPTSWDYCICRIFPVYSPQ